MLQTFDHLLLLGRPAAGKSEFIEFMRGTPDEDRAGRFHIGRFEELDDFPWIWQKFLEDDLWEEAGRPRIFSRRYGENYGLAPGAEGLYDFMLARIDHEVAARFLTRPKFYDGGTLVIEFSRGGKDGYGRALRRLSRPLLERAAILYLKVSFEESWRRNVARYEEKLKHSILAHMVPRETMELFYAADDWGDVTGGRAGGSLDLGGVRVPFVTMENEPELKERGPLAERYAPALKKLMELTKEFISHYTSDCGSWPAARRALKP